MNNTHFEDIDKCLADDFSNYSVIFKRNVGQYEPQTKQLDGFNKEKFEQTKLKNRKKRKKRAKK